jgi:DNA-binding transcriptional LysR family regulator
MTTSASSVTVAWTVVADRPRAAIARIDNRRLKVKLLNRTTRFVRTTEVGQRYLDDARRILAEGELPDSNMQATAVGSVRLVVCASKEYLRRHGVPRTPEELLQHTIIASSAGSASISWRFGGRMLRIEPRLAVTTNDGAIEAALRGFGITRMLSYQVSPYVRAGDLRTVLEEHEPAPRPINIVHREGRHACAKVRAFVDLIAERLRADRALS